MGIKKGKGVMIELLECGVTLDPKRAHKIAVNCDGDLLVNKGHVSSTAEKADEIANLATNVLRGMIAQLRAIFEGSLVEVYVYFDSLTRVANKEMRASRDLDGFSTIGDAKRIFAHNCRGDGMTVRQLEDGHEAEMMMYKMRDKSKNLNIFLTDDSDFLSIAYGHRPLLRKCERDTSIKCIDDLAQCISETPVSVGSSSHLYSYLRVNELSVFDSCLWVILGNDRQKFVSLDYSDILLDLPPADMCTLIAMCGTDFTSGALTPMSIELVARFIRDNTVKGNLAKLGQLLTKKVYNPTHTYISDEFLELREALDLSNYNVEHDEHAEFVRLMAFFLFTLKFNANPRSLMVRLNREIHECLCHPDHAVSALICCVTRLMQYRAYLVNGTMGESIPEFRNYPRLLRYAVNMLIDTPNPAADEHSCRCGDFDKAKMKGLFEETRLVDNVKFLLSELFIKLCDELYNLLSDDENDE